MKRAKIIFALILALCMVFTLCACGAKEETKAPAADEAPTKVIELTYAHMNTTDNTSGIYAQWFCDRLTELTNGEIVVTVYPNNELGSIQEQAEMIAAGTIDLHHSTWGGLSVLMPEIEWMDTPYLFASVEDAVKFSDITTSPIMQEVNEKLIETANIRVLNCIYSGARQLTCNKPIYSPADLAGVKIRAIPSDVYVTAVEGMGAIPVAIDWADTPTALATGVADGQENPPVSIFTASLQDSQKYMMDTKHIMAIGPTVMNETTYQSLSPEHQAAVDQAAYETWEKFTASNIEAEEQYTQKLIDAGMIFITEAEGLDKAAFKASVDAKVAETYARYADQYAALAEWLGY